MMLAVLAASCSNEGLELVDNSNEMANGRMEIGQVELSLNNEVDSRYAIGSNFNDLEAEEGDELGAALIDTWAGTTNAYDYKYDYYLTDYINTNYSFKFNGETWASEAKMVEGNYFFYAPYNAKHVTRASVTAKLNPVQQLTLNADGTIDALSAIKELKESGEVMAVGYKFISREDGKNVEASLRPIYAYPLISITNDYEDDDDEAIDLVINQIVISNTTGFETEATFDFVEGTGKTAISTESGVVAELRDFTYYQSSSKPNEPEQGLFAKNYGGDENYTADLLNEDKTPSSAIVVKAPANYTLKAGATTEFYVVLPAGNHEDLNVDVYTNKGVFNLATDLDLNIAAGKRYDIKYYADGALKNDPEVPAGENLTFSIAEGPDGTVSNIVTSSEDIVELIKNYKKTEDGNTLSVQPLNSDIEINAAVMNAIKAKSSGFTLNVTSLATISSSLNSSNKNIVFEEGAVVKTGEIALNDKVKFNKTLTIKGGTVTTNSTFENGLLIEDGSVTLSADADATLTGGTLTVGDDDFTGGITNNGGTVEFTAGASGSGNGKTYKNDIKNNKGTVNVPAYATVSIINNGHADGDGDGEEDVATAGEVNVAANGSVNVTTNEVGTIKVTGTANVEKNLDLVKMMVGGTATVNENDGKIDNTNNANVDADGIIYYEFTEDVNGKLTAKSSNYNTIILNNITWAPEGEQTVEADVIMINSTIEIWDVEAIITINGDLKATNTGNKTSKISGVKASLVKVNSFTSNGIVQTPDGIVSVDGNSEENGEEV